jgi:hypothetical protein
LNLVQAAIFRSKIGTLLDTRVERNRIHRHGIISLITTLFLFIEQICAILFLHSPRISENPVYGK